MGQGMPGGPRNASWRECLIAGVPEAGVSSGVSSGVPMKGVPDEIDTAAGVACYVDGQDYVVSCAGAAGACWMWCVHTSPVLPVR